ncbi:hypothetical protein [Enterococcus gilvus]|uniref:hypothetical protein n=1 Tax=Enterococcus gilvus TaxID=160453 RepID=UPI003ED885F2
MNKKYKSLDFWAKILGISVSLFTMVNVFLNYSQIKKLNDEKVKTELFEQAKYISTWSTEFDGNTQKVTLSNADNTPVYKVFVLLASSQDRRGNMNDYLKFAIGHEESRYATYIDVLPPGDHKVEMNSPGIAAGGTHASPFMFFTDYKNNQWVRYPSGKLETYDDYEKKFRELGFNPPYGLGTLEGQK